MCRCLHLSLAFLQVLAQYLLHTRINDDDAVMRTLDPDTAAPVQRRMREQGISFKRALNDTVRAGEAGEQFRTATADLGIPTVNLDHALHLAGELVLQP